MHGFLIGKTIDNYRILEVLGHGGMGTVFKALDTTLDKVVALKMMDPRLTDEAEFLTRFRTEGQSQARLQHPNVVTVHALRETKQGSFIVMEFVDGYTLQDLIKQQGARPWGEIRTIFLQLLDAVEHAHRKGIIHRDIKPQNVMIDSQGNAKVTDFGLAKIQQDFGVTRTGLSGGTLTYSSPEQIRSLKDTDFRSDIYSVGMTLYAALAGRLPFAKSESQVSIQLAIIEGRIPPPSEFNPAIPPALELTVLQAIHVDSTRRFQSAAAMKAALEKLDPETGTAEYEASQQHPARTSTPSRSAPPRGKAETDFATRPISDPRAPALRRRSGSILLALLVTAVLVSVFWFGRDMVSGGEDASLAPVPESQGESPPVEAVPVLGSISVSSQPSGAEILIDGEKVPNVVTPAILDSLSAGQYDVRVQKRGYAAKTLSATVEAGGRVELSANLTAETASLTIRSTPSGAAIYIDGRRLSGRQTPATIDDLSPGRRRIRLSRSGYEDYQTTVNLKAGESARSVNARLTAGTGELAVYAQPYGSIYIDGKLEQKESNVRLSRKLPPGLYTVRVTHPAFGEYERQIRIHPGRSVEVPVDFNRILSVTVTAFDENDRPVFANIILNGEATGDYTPKQLRLRFGSHTIGVRKEGYTLPGGPREILLEENLSEPLRFTLQKNR